MATVENDRIADAIKSRVSAGTSITVKQLADEFGVSRRVVAAAYDRVVRETGSDPLLDRTRASLKSAGSLNLSAR